MVAMVQFGYAIAVAMACGWPWSMFAVAGAAGIRTLRKGRSLWAHGTSRWATERDLRKAGMIDGDKGLMIGRLGDSKPPTWPQVIPPLFSPRLCSKAACDQFLGVLSPSKKGRLVRLSKAVHTAIFAPTGTGKGVSLAIPFLLTSGESCVVVDYKGELTLATAEHREKAFGHKVVILDPFKVVTQ